MDIYKPGREVTMKKTSAEKQNIFIIICDQLSAAALASYGNTYSQTPNLDSLAADSVIFDHAYTNCPLCQPSRASFWTSRYPHQTDIRSNLPDQGFPALADHIPTLGEYFSRCGYQCIHFGKTHDYGALRGFEVIDSTEIKIPRTNPGIIFDYETYLDVDTTGKTVDFLNSSHDQPFLAVADLQNPHNICAYIGENAAGRQQHFPLCRELPPLPANFEFTDLPNRPEVIQYMCCAHRRQRQVCGWKEEDYRYYLYAYYYYLEIVDRQIGELLLALKHNNLEENTLIVFFADHGEGMAAHQLVTKYAAFYEETNRIPLMFKGPGLNPGRIGGVCSLLDLFPTLLEYSGLVIPPVLEGSSLLPELTGPSRQTGRDYVYGEWHDEFCGYTVPGRMICDTGYKYICYAEANGEELYNLADDPLETRNLAACPESRKVLALYRNKLKDQAARTNDDFFRLRTSGTADYRQHPVGFHHHSGLSAVEHYAESQKKH